MVIGVVLDAFIGHDTGFDEIMDDICMLVGVWYNWLKVYMNNED